MSWRAQGMRTWLMQRLTAVYMLLYLIGFGIYILNQNVHDYDSWKSLFAHPFANLITGLFLLAILYHAWVGVRDILIDYIKWSPLRFFLWVIITTGLATLGALVAMILYSVVSL